MTGTTQADASSNRWGVIFTAIALILVLAGGLALRLYRITDESASLEEYVGFENLAAPDVVTYVQATHETYFSSYPFPYIVLYYWTQVFGSSLLSGRLMHVAFSMLALVTLFAFTYTFYGGGAWGRRAGLVATLLGSMAYMQVFFAQEVRLYALLTFLALVSLYAFLKMLRGGHWSWWLLNIAVNLMIAMTHGLAVVLPFVQGIALVLLFQREWLGRAGWVGAHVLIAGVWFWWMDLSNLQPSHVFGNYVPQVTLSAFLNDTLGDDIVNRSRHVPRVIETWSFIEERYGEIFWGWREPVAYLMMALFAAGAGWAAFQLSRAFLSPTPAEGGPAPTPAWRDYALVLLFWLLPPLVLILLAFYKPAHFPRYTLYATFGMYVMLGGMIGSWRVFWLRWAAVLVLIALYAYQLSQLLPGPIRTDWASMRERVVDEAHEDDLIFVQSGSYHPTFLYNMRALEDPIAIGVSDAGIMGRGEFFSDFMVNRSIMPNVVDPISSQEGLCDVADIMLEACAKSPNVRDQLRAVWLHTMSEHGDTRNVGECLRQRGIPFEVTYYEGERKSALYRVSNPHGRLPREEPALSMMPFAEFAQKYADDPALLRFQKVNRYYDYDRGLAYAKVGLHLAARGDLELAEICLRKAIVERPSFVSVFSDRAVQVLAEGAQDPEPDPDRVLSIGAVDEGFLWVVAANEYIRKAQYREALEALYKALKANPNDMLANLNRWRAEVGLITNEDPTAGKEALMAVIEKDALLAGKMMPMYQNLYENPNCVEALRLILEWEAQWTPLSPALKYYLSQTCGGEAVIAKLREQIANPEASASSYRELAAQLLQAGQPDEAAQYAGRAAQMDPYDAENHRVYGRALIMLGEYAAAREQLEKASARQSGNVHYRAGIAQIDMARGDYDAAFRYLEQVARDLPGNAFAQFMAGMSGVAADEPETARGYLNRAKEMSTSMPLASEAEMGISEQTGGQSGRIPVEAEIELMLGILALREGNAAAADQHFNAAMNAAYMWPPTPRVAQALLQEQYGELADFVRQAEARGNPEWRWLREFAEQLQARQQSGQDA